MSLRLREGGRSHPPAPTPRLRPANAFIDPFPAPSAMRIEMRCLLMYNMARVSAGSVLAVLRSAPPPSGVRSWCDPPAGDWSVVVFFGCVPDGCCRVPSFSCVGCRVVDFRFNPFPGVGRSRGRGDCGERRRRQPGPPVEGRGLADAGDRPGTVRGVDRRGSRRSGRTRGGRRGRISPRDAVPGGGGVDDRPAAVHRAGT